MTQDTDTPGDDVARDDAGHKNRHVDRPESRDDDNRDDASKNPQRLEREVDQARARLARSASELSDRLSPGELIDQALGMAREHGGEFGRNLGSQVKNNPMPMILTGIGISWMIMSSGDKGAAPASASHATSTDNNESSFLDALGDTAAKSRDKASAAGDQLHGATANMKEQAQNAGESLAQFYRDQPLIAGSVGIAIGAALGALVPSSEIEDDMLGEASDRSVEEARSKASAKYDEVRESVRSE